MSVELNHTIRVRHRPQAFRRVPRRDPRSHRRRCVGPFLPIATSNGVTLDFADAGGKIASQHYAVLCWRRLRRHFSNDRRGGCDHWADP